MRRSVVLATVSVTAACAASAAPAMAVDPPFVPAGVSAAGVDLSGLTLTDAQARLDQNLGPRFAQPLTLGAAGKPWVLTPEQAKLSFDSLTTAKRALRATAPGEVPLKLTHSKLAVRAWVGEVAKQVLRQGRNANVTIGLKRVTVTGIKHGKGLDSAAVEQQVNAALDDPAAPRVLHTALQKVTPATTLAQLREQYGTIITIDQSTFRLRLFKNFKWVKTYGVAVGQPAYPTPNGTFSIQSKQVNPTWSVPNSPWAGELQGTTVEGGSAANPLKARWMGVAGSVGIHGTGEDYSIGTRASHGCIRMHVGDVIDLFNRVSIGTTVKIGAS